MIRYEWIFFVSMTVVGGVAGVILEEHVSSHSTAWSKIAFIVLFGLNFASVVEILKYYLYSRQHSEDQLRGSLRDIRTQRDDITAGLNTVLGKLSNVMQHSALFTEDGNFERVLSSLTNHDLGNARWLIAKFISEKLNRDFRQISIQRVSALEYSFLVEKLIPECAHSISLTVPYTPRAWLELLISDQTKLERIRDGGHLSDGDIPPHIRAFLSSRVDIKRRLVILNDQAEGTEINEWAELLDPAQQHYFEEFIRFNKEVTIRFVQLSRLLSQFPELISSSMSRASSGDQNSIDFKTTDLGIYDQSIIITWTADGDKNIGELVLSREVPRVLTHIFDFYHMGHEYKTPEDIRNMIQAAE